MRYLRSALRRNYCPRCRVSLLSSEWDQVVPRRSNHQGNQLLTYN